MKNIKQLLQFTTIFLSASLLLIACKKDTQNGYLSKEIKFPSQAFIKVQIGTRLIMTGPAATDESTKPIKFSIAAIKDTFGNVLENTMNYRVNTTFWDSAYTGKELSVAAVDAKRTVVNRPAIDIDSLNGRIIIYPETRDSIKIPTGYYIIDILVENSAGSRLYKSAVKLNLSYAGPTTYVFLGVDGKVSGFNVTMKKKVATGNKLTVRTYQPNGTYINMNEFKGYNYASGSAPPDIKDFFNMGLGNPIKTENFADRFEITINKFPLPYILGGVVTIDLYNEGSINGNYFNFWFQFAILQDGEWDMDIHLLW